MSYAEIVKNLLLQDLEELAAEPKLFCRRPGLDFTRNRKLPFKDLILLMLSMEADTTRMELLKYFSFSSDAPSNSAFYQQREKLLPEALQILFKSFNSHFSPSLYKGKYQLLACDGCAFSYTRYAGEPDCHYAPDERTTFGYNQIHMTALYDVLSKRYCDAIIQPARTKNEYLCLANMIERLPDSEYTPLIFADRGFASYNVFAHAIERGVLFMIRVNDKRFERLLGSERPDSESFDIRIDRILTRSNSHRKRQHPELEDKYRFISPEVKFDYIEHKSGKEYPIRLRTLRFKISEDSYENIVTNLPEEDFSADEIRELYHRRWDIETSFREFKYILGGCRFHSKKKDFIEMELWARLILYNFCSIISMHVIIEKKGRRHIYQVNYTVAFKSCRYFLRLQCRESPPDIEGLIGQNTLPVRPGRNRKRHPRFRIPVSFIYRI